MLLYRAHSELLHLVPTVRVKVEKGRRQIHGQQVYKQIPEGLDRKILANIPNPTIAETRAVQGKLSDMPWPGS